MEIKTERLKLRSVEKIDLENIHSLLMYPESALFNPSGFPDGIDHTAQMVDAWSAQINEFDTRKDYTFYIETLKEKEFIGLINISVVKLRYRNAEVWFKLVPTMWNKGYATEAFNQILTFGFKELNFHRIEGGCAVENIASAKVMEKVGMVKEACRRKILPLKDGWSDNYEFAILEEEYPH